MSAVKALQQWCRVQCEGYRDVSITNMTTSFRDGLAFCALIHKHRPELINFDSLSKEDVYENNKLAFKVAEEQLGIPALLDAEDMVALKVPDRLSILTYVSQYYNYFHGRSPIGGMGAIKRPADGFVGEVPGKKNQAVVSKVFPGPEETRENSPPPFINRTRPSPSPKQTRSALQDVNAEKTSQTGTLSNKCASCNTHVHLVQRHLLDGKLYHRNCARQLSSNTSAPLRDLPTNNNVSKPQPDASKTRTTTPAYTPIKAGPPWLAKKPATPSSVSSTPSPPPSTVSASTAKERVVSKPTASRVPTNTSSITTPVPAPRTSLHAAKTNESKLKFLQAENTPKPEEKVTTTFKLDINKGHGVTAKTPETYVGQAVTLVVGVKDQNKGANVAKTIGVAETVKDKQTESESSKKKASAAAFLSKKITEENNNSKPAWANVALRKTDKPQPQIETTKKQTEAPRGRTRLKANPALLADLEPTDDHSSASSPVRHSRLPDRTPDKGGLKSGKASPNTSVSENESPADWRSKLKPVSKENKETKPTSVSVSPAKPWSNGAGKTTERPGGSSPTPPYLASSPANAHSPKGQEKSPKPQSVNGTKPELKSSKTKPDYIPREEIIKELQAIEENLNELERRGVELEVKLRSEDEGADDSVTDELMVEWFSLIRNKQVAMRRESELVYIGRTQDLEEQQPSVEQQLRRLMDKPEHLKTEGDRKKEAELMEKLLEIINDRNAIVEGLDEDRLREEEEDEKLNKMMMDFNVKKDKAKKKSRSRLFSWGNKKEG
ncbi:protein-methionine sulfoxide oxidase mical2b [Oryzias melastigma]|uniref:Mical-like 2b n=2 Tax=Oryzias melastigma TaxID=30732 RepID=A0A3B3DT43_ORYME|nr:protein-methionine sulfoxide oxidase mical2b [Oryzias melastigma]XP_024114993.1 protein-methionine sulfoxide oxidase mical2b [Oryzias melastigma]